ncbi:MAG: hypothetical protein Q4B28_06875 [bacterium]|nr:hypothetical protein [bacterium]
MLNLVAFVEVLKKNEKLKAILGDRIFLEMPKMEQKGISILLSLTAETVETIRTKRSLLDIRVIGHDANVSLQELYEVVELLNQSLVYDFEYEKFGCVKIVEEGISPPLTDEKGRFDLVKSYLCYHSI